jgi:hypothetical protein
MWLDLERLLGDKAKGALSMMSTGNAADRRHPLPVEGMRMLLRHLEPFVPRHPTFLAGARLGSVLGYS